MRRKRARPSGYSIDGAKARSAATVSANRIHRTRPMTEAAARTPSRASDVDDCPDPFAALPITAGAVGAAADRAVTPLPGGGADIGVTRTDRATTTGAVGHAFETCPAMIRSPRIPIRIALQRGCSEDSRNRHGHNAKYKREAVFIGKINSWPLSGSRIERCDWKSPVRDPRSVRMGGIAIGWLGPLPRSARESRGVVRADPP